MTNTFIWADLSTFDLSAAKEFYRHCFDWSFQDLEDDYLVCARGREPAAGLYVMPDKFQRIRMPSFWMSYIHVNDIEETVRIAKQCGAKIELEPQAAPGGGLVALIRDPAGAGFTCYEGEGLGFVKTPETGGRVAWNELHVSSLEKVRPFYSKIFSWVITSSNQSDRYDIWTASGDRIAGIRVTANEIKGDKEYWGVYFSVANLQTSREKVLAAGGEIVAEEVLGNRTSVLAYDSQGAVFYLIGGDSTSKNGHDNVLSKMKWRAMIGLFIVALAVVFDASWIWAILFLIWVIPDIKNGSTHFLEHIERRSNPGLFWLIVGTWLCLSLYILAEWFLSL